MRFGFSCAVSFTSQYSNSRVISMDCDFSGEVHLYQCLWQQMIAILLLFMALELKLNIFIPFAYGIKWKLITYQNPNTVRTNKGDNQCHDGPK